MIFDKTFKIDIHATRGSCIRNVHETKRFLHFQSLISRDRDRANILSSFERF